MASEKELNRFGHNTTTTEDMAGNIPYRITKDQKKHVDFNSSAFFSRTQFNSHNWKQVDSLYLYCNILQNTNNAILCLLL